MISSILATHHLVLAGGALETENDLLGGLGLLVENRLSLSSVTWFSSSIRVSSTSNSLPACLADMTTGDLPDCFRS